MGCSVPSKDRMPRGLRPRGILSCEWHSILHTHEEFRFCAQIVFLHFNFLVLTFKSRCYFVYDIFAIVRMPLRCNVLECFTARFIAVGV